MTYAKKVVLPTIIISFLIFLTGTILFFTLDQTSIIKDSLLITAIAQFALVTVVLIWLTIQENKAVKIYIFIYAFLSLLLIVVPRGVGGYLNCGVGETCESVFVYYFILLILYAIQSLVGSFLVIKTSLKK